MKLIQIPLLAFVVFAALKVYETYRRRGLRTPSFLTWTLLWTGSALIIIFPESTSFLARALGIWRGADLIMYVGLLILFYRMFRFQLALEQMNQALTEVVRAMALAQLSTPTAAEAAQPPPLQQG